MELTPRQKSVFDFICDHHRRHGFPPTVREICDRLGLAGPAGVHRILGVLEAKGYVCSTPGKKRSWRPAKIPSAFEMPVAGRIAAGEPLDVWAQPDAYIPMDPLMFGHEACFALKVKGDSMSGVHVRDGDLAIIRPQPDVDNGEIGAVLVEGVLTEATLKMVYKRRNVIELHAANPAYELMSFSQRTRYRVRIVGKYAGLVRLHG